MERTMPSSINYQDVLPLSVPAIARRRRFFPANGTTFSAAGSNEIRIEISSMNSLLDAQHSYLEFEVVNQSLTTLGFDAGGGAIFFDTLRIEQGGRVLSELQGYNRLHAAILDPLQVSWNGKTSESLTQGQRGFNGGAGAAGAVAPAGVPAVARAGDTYGNCKHNIDTQIPVAGVYRFTMPLTSGLFTQDKLIPLPLVSQSAPITISLLMTAETNVGAWAAAPAAGDIEIRKISYTAQLIEVGRDVIDQIKQTQSLMGGQLAISGQDWEHQVGLLPAASVGENIVRMPSRKRSINSLFWLAQSNDLANTAGPLANNSSLYNMSYAGTANVDNWQLKVGSVVYPPTAIDGPLRDATGGLLANSAFSRGESVMELAKALGTLGFVNPTGRLNTLTWGTDAAGLGDGDNGTALAATVAPSSDTVQCFCPFGIDLDSFQHEALEAGTDTQTLSQETNLILNIQVAATSGLENKNIHMWIIYDQHYYFNANGMITFSN